jgi:hypothetical protein
VTPPLGGGAFVWYIRGWGPSGYGAWSAMRLFTLKDPTLTWGRKLPPTRRFALVLDNLAVLDNETGLVWQRTFGNADVLYPVAITGCGSAITGGRGGWRIPTLAELRSLIDPTQSNPSLPAGHPIVISNPGAYYWSTTRPDQTAQGFLLMRFYEGQLYATSEGPAHLVCVRGGAQSTP